MATFSDSAWVQTVSNNTQLTEKQVAKIMLIKKFITCFFRNKERKSLVFFQCFLGGVLAIVLGPAYGTSTLETFDTLQQAYRDIDEQQEMTREAFESITIHKDEGDASQHIKELTGRYFSVKEIVPKRPEENTRTFLNNHFKLFRPENSLSDYSKLKSMRARDNSFRREFFDQENACAFEHYQLASLVPIRFNCRSLSVMTLNARIHPDDPAFRGVGDPSPHGWVERLPRIVEMLRGYEAGRGPHIIGMQEVRGGRYPEQLNDLRDQLPTYQSIYSRRGGLIHGHEGVLLLWRSDRIELLDHGEIIMSQSDRRKRANCRGRGTRGYYPINRNIIWGYFRDRLVNRTFYVYNTHLGGGGLCQVRGSIMILLDHIMRRSNSDAPVRDLAFIKIPEAR